jgi:hypothetical protein
MSNTKPTIVMRKAEPTAKPGAFLGVDAPNVVEAGGHSAIARRVSQHELPTSIRAARLHRCHRRRVHNARGGWCRSCRQIPRDEPVAVSAA